MRYSHPPHTYATVAVFFSVTRYGARGWRWDRGSGGGEAFGSRIPVSLFSILGATFRYGLELDLFPRPRFPSPRVSRCIERE